MAHDTELTATSHGSNPQAWHIRNQTFRYHRSRRMSMDSDAGLVLPTRNIGGYGNLDVEVSRDSGSGAANTIVEADPELWIENLDRRDPLDYQKDTVPRGRRFIESNKNLSDANVFYITAEPAMPEIPVRCIVNGFDPARFPIYWRLQCRHNLCRFLPLGGSQYWGMCRVFDEEWHGRSEDSHFSIFGQASQPGLFYDYNPPDQGRIMGGHGILTVAAWPDNSQVMLLDYVHLRIAGTDPTRATAKRFIEDQLSGYDANLILIAKYVMDHESGKYKYPTDAHQFEAGVQSYSSMHYHPRRHKGHPEDHKVRFNWPADPPNFPAVEFDWGVGQMQINELRNRHVEARHAWDWKANITGGLNLMLESMRKRAARQGETWKKWAPRSLAGYNPNYPKAFDHNEPYFNQLDDAIVPRALKLDELPMTPPSPQPPPWPPPSLQLPS